jgi:hypothetical protein
MMAAPKTGTRGAFERRERPYKGEHERSVQQPTPPRSWEALAAWFRDAWETSLPARLHTRGVEDGSALGAPRMSGAMHARIDHAGQRGWGVSGWDREGQPRGMTDDGLTRDPFLYYLERRLREDDGDAVALVRWAYVGYDIEEAANNAFVKRIRLREADPDGWTDWLSSYTATLERGIRRLWYDCQREPVRYAVCRVCRRRECVCGSKSEAQVNAEEMA